MASEMTGVPLEKSWEKEKQRYLDIIYSKSEPKIYLEIERINLKNSENKLILFKIPKSWNAPHRVKLGKFKEFYIRRDGRTDPLELDEIKNIFSFSGRVMEKIEDFREKRVFKIYSENTGSFKLIFHAIPLNAFEQTHYDLSNIQDYISNLKSLKGIYKPNFEGIYTQSSCLHKQLYRNGIFERIYFAKANNKSVKLSSTFKSIKEFIQDIFKLYEKMNIHSPIIFFITYTNIKDCNQLNSFGMNIHEISDKNRDILPSNSIYLEYFKEETVDEAIYDSLIPFWNHFGFEDIEYKE